MRKTVINLLLIFATLVLALALAEVVMRIFFHQNLRIEPKGAYVPFYRLMRMKPNYYGELSNFTKKTHWKINPQGRRGKILSPQKAKDHYRIALLGDSFTFGYGVEEEEAYPYKLEHLLNQNGKNKVETINFGVNGYGVIGCLNMLKHEGIQYHPDLVVLAFYTGNDLFDTLREEKALARKFKVQLQENLSGLERAKEIIGSNLYFYAFCSQRMHEFMVRTGIRKLIDHNIGAFKKDEPASVEQGWALIEKSIQEMANYCQARKVDFMVLIIPSRPQINLREWEWVLQAQKLNQKDYQIDRPQEKLTRICKRLGCLYLDLEPEFKKSGKNLYFSFADIHLNEDGQAETARLLARYIRQRSFIRF